MRLKDYCKEVRGCRGRYILTHLFDHIKWAWQRVWRGYDDSDVWACCETMRDRLIDILTDYKEHRWGSWNVPSEYPKHQELFGLFYPGEWTDALIDTLIFHIKMSDEDYCLNVVYPNYDPLAHDFDRERFLRAHSIRKQNQDAAFELLKVFWDDMWD